MCAIVCIHSAMSDAETIDSGWGAAADHGSSPSGSLWQVNTRGRKVIAMTERELAASYRGGKLTGRSLVWGDGMSEWTPLGDVAQLAKLLRDSEPPQSGTRPRLEELTSGTEPYAASADVTTNTGGIAVYERAVAMIEFPDAIEPAEPADEPTPSFATPTATPSAKARATVNAPLPRLAGRKPPDIKAVERKSSPAKARPTPRPAADDTNEEEPETIRPKAGDLKAEDFPRIPPAPGVPSIRETLPGPIFPAPVLASPLAAALSAAAPPASSPTASSTPLPVTTRMTSTPLPVTTRMTSTPLPVTTRMASSPVPPKARPKTPIPSGPFGAPAPQQFVASAPSVSVSTPSVAASTPSVAASTPSVSASAPSVAASTPSVAASAPSVAASTPSVAAPKTPAAAAVPPPPPLPHELELSAAEVATAPRPPAFVDATALVKPPRPAIEFLPPIIVHEKEEDDGASGILELPLHGALQEAPFSESTLVLSGRRRARRWIPLQAVIALCVGAACFASALTAFFVRTRPAPAPRVVERIVTVPAAPVERVAPAPVSTEPAHAAATAPEAEPKAATPEPARTASPERSSTKTESTKTESTKTAASESGAATRSKEGWRQDPGLATSDEAKPRREARAGFPTSPGF